jgi:sigma-E factor negative regulatory protein RseC
LIEQQARVIDARGSTVSIRIGGQSGCTACDEGRGCGAGIFGKLLRRKPVELDMDNTIDAAAGQAVRLGISDRLFLRLVFRLYGAPLLAGIIGGAVAYRMAFSQGAGDGLADLLTLLGALVSAAVALIFLNRNTTPDISPADIRLLERPEAGSVCGAGPETH